MNLIVDTSVWSLVLRRAKVDEFHPCVQAFRFHVEKGDGIFLIGSILQELLDGVRSSSNFNRLLKILSPFPLIPFEREEYILAARLRNICRQRGVQASPIDFLITTASISKGFPLLTADRDFSLIAKYCELQLIVG